MHIMQSSRDPVVLLLRRIALRALGGSLLTGAAFAACGEADTCAEDDELRRVMRDIAVDEARHAALSYEVHAWASERLDLATLVQIREAQRVQLDDLHDACARQPDSRLARQAGLPSAATGSAMLQELTRTLIGPRFAVHA